MKLSFFKAWALAAVLCAHQAAFATQAIIDEDHDGLSDTWENQFGFNTDENETTPTEQAGMADPDHDGRTNLEESAAGTDPWSGESSDGFFQAHAGWSQLLANTFVVGWYGVEGKVYQLYGSPDLGANWIAQGEPVEGTGGTIEFNLPLEDVEVANRFFWRLETVALDSDGDGLDDEADLYPLDRFNGARPLLLVAGEWTVKTTNASGAPVEHVEIEFRKWHSEAQGVEEEWLSTGETGADGCLTFDPEELEEGERVVARLAGNAQQRVYLPWRPGSEIVDTNPIVPGGTGWSEEDLQDLLTNGGVNGGGIGQVPNLAGNPGNGAPVDEKGEDEGGKMDSLRLCDIVDAWHQMSHDRGWTENAVHIASGADMSTLVVSSSPIAIEDPWYGTSSKDYYYGYRFSEGPYLYGVNWGDYYEHAGEVSLELTPRLVPESKAIPIQATFLNKIEFFNDGPNTPWSEAKPSMSLSLGGTLPIPIPQSLDPAKEEIVRLSGPETSPALHSNVVLGPVPAHVPKEVILGGDFYFRNFITLEVQAELPFGFPFEPTGPILEPTGYTKVHWTVEITDGTEFAKVKFKDAINESAVFTAPSSGMTSTDWSTPAITIAFVQGEEPMEVGDSFQIHVQAVADGVPFGASTLGGIPLGGFDMTFKFASEGQRGPEDAALEQVAELKGALDDEGDVSAFESDPLRAGQRNQTLEEERKVGLNGLPAPGASTFVDALTLRFHHGEGDFHLPVPGSDLSLSVFRNCSESIWTKVSGLRPNEDPLLPFGPGWSSNLAAAAVWSRTVVAEAPPDGSVIGSVRVADYSGRSFFFSEIKQGPQSIFVADPSLLPDRGNSKVELTKLVTGELQLKQPLLGITQVFQNADLEITLPNNRDLPEDSGATHSDYYRLASVTDRHGNSLAWFYGSSGSTAGKLIPDSIHVVGRDGLKLRFQQENGRVVAFWDPSGVKHSYGYVAGPAGSGLTVLGHHIVGDRTVASYGYQFVTEADPRPVAMRLPLQSAPTSFYEVPTYHMALNRIANGAGDETSIQLALSEVREAYSGRGNAFFRVAGDPLVVDHVDLPGSGALVEFGGEHHLKPAQGEDPAVTVVRTEVTDMWGHDWTYEWAAPQEIRWRPAFSGLPAISGLFFPSLTKSCGDLANSEVTFEYDLAAGFALKSVQDAAGRKSKISHDILTGANPGVWYGPPVDSLSSGGVAVLGSRAMEPSQIEDVRGFKTSFTYTEEERLPETTEDHQGRVTEISYGAFPLPLVPKSIRLWGGRTESGRPTNLLSQTTIDYHPVLGALPVRVTKENAGSFAMDDPEWVVPLTQTVQIDAGGLGWPAKTGYDGNGDGDLDDASDLASETTFSTSGRVLEMRSLNGGARSFAYDSAGLLNSICYEDGASVSFDYDKAGRVALARDPLGHASGTAYDALGRVVKTIRDVEGATALSFNPLTSAFSGVNTGHDVIGEIQYDDANNLVRSIDARGNIRVAEMDPLRRVVKAISPRADRAPGGVPTEAGGDPVSEVHYNPLISATGPESTLDPLGYETLYLYDDKGRLEEIRGEYDQDSTPHLYRSVRYGYGDDGLPDSVTVTRTPVDATGEIVGAGPREELSSRVHYDALDRPALLIAGEGSGREIHRKFSYTSTGLPWQVGVRDDIANDGWQVTSSEYDALGRVTKQILPRVMDASTDSESSPEFQTTYGPDGSVQSVSDAYGNVTSFLYNVLGNASQTLGPEVRDVRSGLSTRPASSQCYDAAGRTVAATDPLSRTWEYRWDAVGRLRASLGPLMNPGEEDENKRRAVTTYNPSLTGEDEIIDAEGHRTFTTYDATGQVRQTRSRLTSVEPSGSSAEGDLVEKITRDLLGRVESTEDGEGHLTRFTYDGFGRLTSRTWDPGEPARERTESVFYDALLRTGREDAKGQATAFEYDGRFQLQWVIPADKPAELLEFIRDDLGRLTGVNAADGVSGMGNADCTYTYDALGRLETEVSNGKTTTYGYDLNGLPASITSSQNGRKLSLIHDAAGRVTSLQDTLSGLTRTTGFGYDVGGRLLREELANGLVETSSYDRMGRLTGKQLRTTDWNVLCGSRYTYDFNSNVTSLREVTGPLAVPSRTVTMEYDERGRLLSEIQAGAVEQTERHGYDLADNRIWSRKSVGGVDTARDYEYGTAANGYNSNQLVGFDETVGAASPVTTSYFYDANGNRTQRSRGGQSDLYFYDSFDRLVEMTLGTAGADNGAYRYAYDHASRRIGREVPDGTKRNFAFAGSSPALEWTPSGPLTENIGGGVGGRLYSYENGTPAWDFHDARGDLLGQTSSGGGLFYRALNDASGRKVAEDGDRRGGYGANSKWEDPGGLINDGFRYRDLDVGLFINRDPAGFIDGLNVYNYVGHNPWTMYDPFGLSGEGDSDGDGVDAPANGGGYVTINPVDYSTWGMCINCHGGPEMINQYLEGMHAAYPMMLAAYGITEVAGGAALTLAGTGVEVGSLGLANPMVAPGMIFGLFLMRDGTEKYIGSFDPDVGSGQLYFMDRFLKNADDDQMVLFWFYAAASLYSVRSPSPSTAAQAADETAAVIKYVEEANAAVSTGKSGGLPWARNQAGVAPSAPADELGSIGGGVRITAEDLAKPGSLTDYSHIADPKDLTKTKPTPRQVKKMKEANRAQNGGVLRDDVTGEVGVDSPKSMSGVTPPSNAIEVDHIKPVDAGGTRAQSNLRLHLKRNNRLKWNKVPPPPEE